MTSDARLNRDVWIFSATRTCVKYAQILRLIIKTAAFNVNWLRSAGRKKCVLGTGIGHWGRTQIVPARQEPKAVL